DTDAGSSSSTPKLIWRAAAAASSRIEWRVVDRIGRKAFDRGAGFLKSAARFLGHFNQTARAYANFMEEALIVPLGEAGDAGRYAMLARDSSGKAIFDAETLRLLHAWPPFKPSFSMKDNCISMGRDQEGVTLTCACDGPSAEVIEHAI